MYGYVCKTPVSDRLNAGEIDLATLWCHMCYRELRSCVPELRQYR
jgi:hypothetical protein